MKNVTATEITKSTLEKEINGKVKKKSGNRIGYNYIILKSLKESQKNDVVKCIYIKSLTNFGFCVIKEGTYGDSKDKHGRDIKDRLIWQQQLHETLQNKVRVPRLLGHFEENGNYYLVLEHIKGKPLYKAIKEKNGDLRDDLNTGTRTGLIFVDYLLQIIKLLDTLHQENVVHRDATANNFIITPDEQVAVIDLELSYSLTHQMPAPPFQLGTYGYMSPEQLRTATPTIKEDIFSAGAVLLQVWTGISPSKLTDAPIEELREKVHFFVPDKDIADIIVQCLHPDPFQRPALKTVYELLAQYKKDLHITKKRAVSNSLVYSKEQINDTIQRAICALCSPLMADEDKGWFSEQTHTVTNRDKNKITKAWYTSFYKGATGVMYLMNQAQQMGFEINVAVPHIKKALSLIETKYINRIDQVSPSLHFGASGIAVSLAQSIKGGLVEPQTDYFSWVNQLLEIDNQVLDFSHGIAGQGMAHWLCHDLLKTDQIPNKLSLYVNYLLQHQEKDGSWTYKMMDSKPQKRLGFATGGAGIIYFLLEYSQKYKDTTVLEHAVRGLKWLIKTSIRKRNAVLWHTDKNKEISFWWNDGTSGIALTFMKAYRCLGNSIYKHYATKSLLNITKQLLNNNLSQHEGLSGLGEVFLEAYYTFHESEWLERADWIAQAIIHFKKEHQKFGSYWLVGNEGQPTADFMVGNSGIIHFLLRYCNPDKIRFPML